MIPTNIEEMATLIYLMEINEWGTDISPELREKLANDAFKSAEAFYKVESLRGKPKYSTEGATTGRIQTRTPNKSSVPRPVFPPNRLHSEGAVKMTTKEAPHESH